MLENELKNLWQNSADNVKFNAERLSNIYLLEKKIDKFDRKLFWRNSIEYAAAIFVVCAMSYNVIFLHQSLMKNLADGLGIAACVFVIYIINKTRKKKSGLVSSLSLLEELHELQLYYTKEKSLLENIAVWYILPFQPSMILVAVDMYLTMPIVHCLIFSTGNVFLVLIIYFINQRAAKKNFVPIIASIDAQIKQWE